MNQSLRLPILMEYTLAIAYWFDEDAMLFYVEYGFSKYHCLLLYYCTTVQFLF